jgi:thiol-disulfide isomerase/thioredoxin
MYKLLFISILVTSILHNNSFAQARTEVYAKLNPPKSVTFTIDSATSNKIRENLDFYYHDILGEGHPLAIFKEGTSLTLNDPSFVIEASGRQLLFLVYPGENIRIKYAGTDSLCFYIPGNEVRNNELRFFRDMVLQTGNIYYGFKVMPYQKRVSTVDSIDLLEKQIADIKNKRIIMLDTWAAKYQFSGLFKQIALTTIQSTAFIDSLVLYFDNQNLLVKQHLYRNLILQKIQSIKEIRFIPLQTYYMACEEIAATAVTGNPFYPIENTSDFDHLFYYSKKEFNEPAKDFMMYRALASAYRKAISVSDNYLDIFNAECKNEIYKNAIAKKKNESNKEICSKGIDQLKPMDQKKSTDIKEVIASNKGKIILLDFWASWCAPCRREMPFAQKLKQKFNNNKVAFIYISLDENPKDWLKASETEGLQRNNFLLMDADSSPFLKEYKVFGIPRYFLLNKDGKVISDDAPRPGEAALEKLIRKNL